MSFEEPKAPIVRIRKKRVKKKSKDNDIVHLPVRASQQTRYSSLTTPPNPQTKSRECCRHAFASCMKIPVCRLICFRCILPKCYAGEGSDDDEADVKDEGYHSQNRRSSEISPHADGGAQGGTEIQEVEMTEIKGETVNLIPPPRTSINDYRRDPCKSRNLVGNDKTEGEVTYIEVESVSIDNEASSNIPKSDSQSSETNIAGLATLDTEYEEPVRAGILDFPLLKPLETVDSSEYVECDHSDDSDESKYYVNESVLGIQVDHAVSSNTSGDIKVDRNYMNFDSVDRDDNKTIRPVKFVEKDIGLSKTIDKPHEYVNLSNLEPKEDSKDQSVDNINDVHASHETNEKKLLRTEEDTDLKQAQDIIHGVESVEDNHSSTNTTDIENGNDVDSVASDSDKNKLIDDLKTKSDHGVDSDNKDSDNDEDTRLTSDQTKLI